MNLTDLRATLDDRSSEAAHAVAAGTRIEGVRARVRATRQRRAAVGALAVVAALAIGYAVVTRGLIDSRPQPATTTPPPTLSVNGFPEYANGAHLIGSRTAAFAEEMAFTVDGSPRGWALAARCTSSEPDRELWVRWQINGQLLTSHSCTDQGGSTVRPDMSRFDPDWRRPDLTSTITARMEATDGKPLPAGTFSVAISERLPYEGYPLPPRPAALRPLDPAPAVNVDPAYGIASVDSDPDDPTRSKTLVLDLAAGASIDMVSQTPGYLHVIVDGTEIATGEWWDYDLAIYGLTIDRPGRHTITFVPEHLSGAWRAVIRP
jgi:hypothetical protein